jgi:hypothetical protein
MPERSDRRVARVRLPPSWAVHPDALDETVVHDPSGRPWLVCTTDRLYGAAPRDPVEDAADDAAGGAPADVPSPPYDARYETQVFYTARAGIRGFPTGHGQRFRAREEALSGHRQWCLRVRLGSVEPDRVPEDPVDEQTA